MERKINLGTIVFVFCVAVVLKVFQYFMLSSEPYALLLFATNLSTAAMCCIGCYIFGTSLSKN